MRQRMEPLDSLVDQLVAHPDMPANEFLQLVNYYLQLNRADRVIVLLSKFVQRFPQNPVGWYNLAVIHSLRGKCDEALPALERSLLVDNAQQQIHSLARQDPKLNNCRRDPRFQRLLGQPQAAAATESLPFDVTR